MQNSIYTPLSGAIAYERALEVIANNLANLNTTGFKGDNVTFTLLEPEPNKHYNNPLPPANYKTNLDDIVPLKGNEISYVGISEIARDPTQGPAVNTNNNLDLMLEGSGYFVVQSQEGLRYTRDGALAMGRDGVLSTKAGHPVLGEKGNIYLRADDFEVNALGEVFQNGEMIDRMLVQSFDSEASLERVGNNYFMYGGPPEGAKTVEFPTIRQGYLEGSNVNAVKSLTAMILAHRSFEAYQKAISNHDQMMDKSSNSIGAVRA